MMTGAKAPLASGSDADGATPGGQSAASSKTLGAAPTSPAGRKSKQESGVASLPTAPSLAKKHQQPAHSDAGASEGAASAPTVRYQGWDLSGFGNTGVKSEDA